jgi:hypothetical protein
VASGEVKSVLLFDVSKDPNETTNLAEQQPERVAKMKSELAAWKDSALKSLAGGDYAPGTAVAPATKSGENRKKAKKGVAQ